MTTRTGYVCKRCGTPSPTGIGYAANAAADTPARADQVVSCACGHSRAPTTDATDAYVVPVDPMDALSCDSCQ